MYLYVHILRAQWEYHAQIQFYKCQNFCKKYHIILDTYPAYLHIKHLFLHTIFPWYLPTVRDDTLLTAVFCVPGGVADCGVRATITHALTATGGAGARHSHPVGHALLVASLQEKNKQIKYFIKLIIYSPNSFQWAKMQVPFSWFIYPYSSGLLHW